VAAAQLPARLNALLGQRLAVLAPAAALLDPGPQVVLRLVAPDSADAYAQQLYALLHRLDAADAERILVVWPPAGPDWEAVHDRLQRARSAA
jgi:L-threonylcarbamoyladenylate synthase